MVLVGVTEALHEIRCQNAKCHRLLAKVALRDGTVQIKCSSCNAMTSFTVTVAVAKPERV